MEALNSLLPLMLYCFGIILLAVLIILGVKLILLLDKVDKKVSSLDSLFDFIDNASNSLVLMGDTIVNGISGIILKLFKNKSKKNKEEDDDE